MALQEVVNTMRESLQASLDDILSPRSSSHSKLKALRNVERHFGNAIFDIKNDCEAKDAFLALQYTFECNVPLHLLSWIALSTTRLEVLTSKGTADETSEVEELADQVVLALSIIQGITLNHEASKAYMGRKCVLEILLDLLLASRHLSPPSDNNSDSNPKSSSPPLTSIVLDTLLCILVDSSNALRVFEESNGVQAVVKILKRAGTPREVRMKCLEFLYFYLLDETPTTSNELKRTHPSPPPTRPATPMKPPKPYLNATPLRPPASRYGSSTFSFSSSGSSASAGLSVSSSSSGSGSTSSRSVSGSSSRSSHSFSSTSSNASSSTAASSTPASPVKESFPPVPPLPKSASKTGVVSGKRFTTPMNQNQNQLLHPHRTPPNSPPFSAGSGSNSGSQSGSGSFSKPPQLRSMMMLRKEVDYVPQSPKKYTGLGVRPTHRKSTSTPVNLDRRSLLTSAELSPTQDKERERKFPTTAKEKLEERSVSSYVLHSSPIVKSGSFDSASSSVLALAPASTFASPKSRNNNSKHDVKWKTTEQKKEFLGTMLGNVDALVEGVRKAGIWGLG